MKKVLFNLLFLTATISLLLVFLYPQKLSEEIQSDETVISELNTPETTIYVSSEEDHQKKIKQIMESYDMSLLSSNLNTYSKIFLEDYFNR